MKIHTGRRWKLLIITAVSVLALLFGIRFCVQLYAAAHPAMSQELKAGFNPVLDYMDENSSEDEYAVIIFMDDEENPDKKRWYYCDNQEALWANGNTAGIRVKNENTNLQQGKPVYLLKNGVPLMEFYRCPWDAELSVGTLPDYWTEISSVEVQQRMEPLFDGVTLEAKQKHVSPGTVSIECVLKNRTCREMMYGQMFNLEYYNGIDWERLVREDMNAGFEAYGISLPAWSRKVHEYRVELYSDLQEPGKYRIVTEIFMPGIQSPVAAVLCAEFIVE